MKDVIEEYRKTIEKYGKQARGRAELLRYLSGKKLTPLQAFKASCYDCMGFYADGKMDCKMPVCSLYPYMPYRAEKQKPVKKVSAMSEEQKTAFAERMKKARQAKT
ncbi:MAG: hypothetical protein ABH868_04515 [bacterium]